MLKPSQAINAVLPRSSSRSFPFLENFRESSRPERRVVWLRPGGADWLSNRAVSGVLTALVPSEKILLLGVDLPAARLRDRKAALPWAVEDALAEPLSKLHLVLGAEIANRHYAVGVVRHSAMAEWRESLAALGSTRCRMIPDALALPKPGLQDWSVAVDGDRILVRGDGAAAFAIDTSLFPLAWERAGRPLLQLYGMGALSDAMGAVTTHVDDRPLEQILIEGAARPALDLATGRYAPQGDGATLALQRVALILVAGVLAYTALIGLDTLAISRLASRRTAEAARLHAEIVPADRRSGDIAADIAALTRTSTLPAGVFLPLMSQAAKALQPIGSEVSLRTLTFAAEDRTLTFGVDVRDFAALQRVQSALTAAGITVESGPAATVAGGVEAELKLHGGDGS